ncbi:ATP-binding cassette domain-containing protein [Winogradskyella sp. 3972H.M.0a.05]|uniref:ABC transporter ATP-binding protein n=1 Tax=Winogradskyella sp. 3972H.M.0a.05 TaxID=2950277 RepID=UPI0033937E1B
MTELQSRINEILKFFDNNDISLGYRKLLDCIIDTQDLSLYEDAIELTDWKEKFPEETEEIIQRSKSILEKVSKKDIKPYKTDESTIKVDVINKSYGTNKFSLGPISLEIKKGDVYGLVGENGNGKTTLLRILAKEISHDSGDIVYNFEETPNSTYDLRTKLVYIPQRTKKWYGSLKDNLKFVLSSYGVNPKENETRVLMMIARMGLWNYKHLKWSELSSGYKMRFELARTLLRKPEVLLLDEPLANLDVLAQQLILEDLKSICNSINNPIALILSSQQLYEVEKVSDKVIYLENGKQNDEIEDKKDTDAKLIIEIDSTVEREPLEQSLHHLQLDKLIYNGGIYIAYFDASTSFSSVMKSLGEHNIEVTYIRNISQSTRRFFVS